MLDFEDNDWKQMLRAAIITGMYGHDLEKKDSIIKVGYEYTNNAPMFLYKYYSNRKEKVDLVKSQKMWYSAPCNFNDVFDSDIVIDEDKIFANALQMIPDKRSRQPGSRMWWQLKQTVNKEIRHLKDTFDDMRTTTGISCLCESCNSLLMWAHYASNHSGICVEYNLMDINKKLGFTPIPVIYSDKRVCFSSINPSAVNFDVEKVFIENLTTKSKEWGYEKEWRIIRDCGACGDKWDSENKGALLDMICPSSVILGCMAKPDFEEYIREYCEEQKINLYKMEKDSHCYHLRKKSVLQLDDLDN